MAAKIILPLIALLVFTAHASEANISAQEAMPAPISFLGARGNASSTPVATKLDMNPAAMEAVITDLLDISGNASASAPGTKLHPTVAPKLDSTSAIMEATLTNLMLGKGQFGATPMGGSVRQIANILKNTMMPKVVAAHKSDQASLYRLANEVKKCGSTKTAALRKSYPSSRYYIRMSRTHKQCRGVEAVRYTSKTACLAKKRALYGVKVWTCRRFAALSRSYGTQKNNRAIMNKAGGEKIETYLSRISTTVCGRHVHGTKGQLNRRGGWGGGLPNSMLDKYMRSKGACKNAKKKYQAKVRECRMKSRAYSRRKGQCNQFQGLMDTNSCKAAVMVKDACESYVGCYQSKKKAYDIFRRSATAQENDRKAEWRGLKRMHCLIAAFGDGKVSNAEVDTCKRQTVNTKFLTLKYPRLPRLVRCALPTLYPATGAYKRREFKPLPNFAKGKASAECAGIKNMPTTPRAGSPRGTRCTRVALNGPYSAGGLVKCTNGFDVRTAFQKNSCPKGTKIFSPRSRTDWKTFLASARPLRAPHWIIDITRPSNGCGGCRNSPMNSRNRQQRSWRTSDGSPWWLRNSRFSEPNGDYNANCFLNLNTPRNENLISFNDGRCHYHSKSYYCQPMKLGLRPKSGSPASCRCNKVELTGRYSAGVLVRCEQCITVYRSTQKNSCPNGMKIFSPANRRDWKTFIDSAGPLRAPHWIVDVTRPQNGCGGCRSYPMKSTQPQQATWRTKDGSPWWLRNSRYNEPNGDYNANCYLDLWRTPNSPDQVTFNDGRCNYRSRSYYCQPNKNNKNYGGFHRRRRAPRKVQLRVRRVRNIPPRGAGRGWRLVRHAPAGYRWHPATDQLRGTHVYGNKAGGMHSRSAWSTRFNNANFDEFLFSTGDNRKWLIASKNQVTGGWYSNSPRTITKSSIRHSPYRARWYRRSPNREDPWISLNDHASAIRSNNLLYGENYFGRRSHTNVVKAHKGANVWIRRSPGIRVPRGVRQQYSQLALLRRGWKVWSDRPYSHSTSSRDLRPNKGQCILWGSKTSSGSTKLRLAAFGRRKAIFPGGSIERRVFENGVYWYIEPRVRGAGRGSAGFSANKNLRLFSADTQHIQSQLRLSWHLWTRRAVGGYRSGRTAGLNGNRLWRKVVMYGPCSVPKTTCPRNFRFMAKNKICYNDRKLADKGSGPCNSWCTLDTGRGSGCGNNRNKMC